MTTPDLIAIPVEAWQNIQRALQAAKALVDDAVALHGDHLSVEERALRDALAPLGERGGA